MTKKQYRVSVLGDGGWGTALACVSERKGNETLLWSVFPEYAAEMAKTRENKKFLSGIKLSDKIQITSNLQEALAFGEIIILAIPTQYMRGVLVQMKAFPLQDKIFVSVAKGIEKQTLLRPSEIIQSILGQVPLAVLSGPSHAQEVARNLPTLMVAASSNEEASKAVQAALNELHFRVYLQNDIVGVELGGALKNVMAIAVGICDGLKLGDNSKAGLLSRALVEMTRLGVKLGANPSTFSGLSGLGDLVTTCYSPYGRNLHVGRELGAGKTIAEILKGMVMVAEGVETARSVHELNQKVQTSIPVMEEVYAVLFCDKPVRQAVKDLLERNASQELKLYS